MNYVTAYPDTSGGLSIYADCTWSLARYDRARWALRLAGRLATTASRKRLLMADWGDFYEAKNDLEKAEVWCRRVLRAFPSTRACVRLGRVLAKQGKLEEAEAVQRRAIRMRTTGEPVDEAHFNLGLVLRGAGRYREAAKHFVAALRIRPRYTLAKDALRDVRAVVTLPALSRSCKLAYKQVRRAQSHGPASGAASAAKYTKAYPNSYCGWLVLAESSWSMNRHDVARQALRRAQRLVAKRDPAIGYLYWGRFFCARHDLRRAESWLRRAASAKPTTCNYVHLGATLAKQGKLAEAERMHRRAIAARTRGDAVDEAHLNLGLVLRALTRLTEAARHFRAALRIDPRYAFAKEALRDVQLARIEHDTFRRLRQTPAS